MIMKTTYILDGLCCPNCAAKIQQAAGKLPGVKTANVDLLTQKMTLILWTQWCLTRPARCGGGRLRGLYRHSR
jgi:cation transport ATPase